MTRQNLPLPVLTGPVLKDIPVNGGGVLAPSGRKTLSLPIDKAVEVAQELMKAGELFHAEVVLVKLLDVRPGHEEARQLLPPLRQLRSYQERVHQMASSSYLEYPMQVHIETIALCNAKCTFCVYSEIERVGARMDDGLFRKIITDLKEIPSHHKYSVVPYKINDPFLDKGIFDKMRLINAELPTAGIILTTNGIALREEHVEKLNDIENLDFFWISLNAHDLESYRRRMGVGAFEKVVKNIHMVLEKFNRPDIVRIGRVRTGTIEDIQFYEFVEKEFGTQKWISGNSQGDFLGDVDKYFPVYPFLPCIHWFEISIIASGMVSFCCMDGHCRWPIGDIRESSVLDVYNSKPYRTFREQVLQRKFVTPCDACTYV